MFKIISGSHYGKCFCLNTDKNLLVLVDPRFPRFVIGTLPLDRINNLSLSSSNYTGITPAGTVLGEIFKMCSFVIECDDATSFSCESKQLQFDPLYRACFDYREPGATAGTSEHQSPALKLNGRTIDQAKQINADWNRLFWYSLYIIGLVAFLYNVNKSAFHLF